MNLDHADWPIFGWQTDMRPALARARQAGRAVVLATLTRVEGPSPRRLGSQMVFKDMSATGYFSGGCIEADIANHALLVLAEAEPRRLIYGRGSPWIDIRLTCGGTLEILLERIGPDDPAVAQLLRFADDRHPVWWFSDGTHRKVGSAPLPVTGSGEYCLRYHPGWRVVVVGGDPIALAIAQLAATTGFETIVVRPNGPQSSSPLEGVDYVRSDVATAIKGIRPDQWTAVVTATHDDDHDDVAIIAALRGETAYVGVLGSAIRIAPRRDRLIAAGLSTTRIGALHAPVGAVMSGKAPWEVAVSVIAEIMQIRNDLATFSSSPAATGRADWQALVARPADAER